jgi:hypothetical protein
LFLLAPKGVNDVPPVFWHELSANSIIAPRFRVMQGEALQAARPLPAGISCEGFASEYQPISASGSCVRISVAVPDFAGSWSTVAS